MHRRRLLIHLVAGGTLASTIACGDAPAGPASSAPSTPAAAAQSADLAVAAYDGGAQSAAVNAFLSYDAPTARSTDLPPGTGSYAVSIVYGPTIDPATFEATSNGENLTAWFHPAPGQSEVVEIPIRQVRTVLKFSVTGTANGRLATDRDSFVLQVQ